MRHACWDHDHAARPQEMRLLAERDRARARQDEVDLSVLRAGAACSS